MVSIINILPSYLIFGIHFLKGWLIAINVYLTLAAKT